MSAEVLRRAAALMRERAEACEPSDSPWRVAERLDCGCCERVRIANGGALGSLLLDADDRYTPHIASWHPTVALAVADWLQRELDTHETCMARNDGLQKQYAHLLADSDALAVARAYLGESA